MKLTFDHHVSEICRKAAGQLNTFKASEFLLPFQCKESLVDAFIFFTFNYCPLA